MEPSTLRKYGYLDAYSYCKGKIEASNLRGWCGNFSDPVDLLIQDISILKSIKDCPKLGAILENNIEGKVDEILHFEITNLLFPYGRCCEAIIPKKAKEAMLARIDIAVSPSMTETASLKQLFVNWLYLAKVDKLPSPSPRENMT